MNVAYKTDIGKKRTVNEDSIFVDELRGIFLIADGLGGHQAGEIASNMAVKEAYLYLKRNLSKAKDEEAISNLLTESLVKAHNAIKAEATTDLNLIGMGTTLIEMLIKDNKAHICHVGDSRVYFLRDGIKQITKDHTFDRYLAEHKDKKVKKRYLPLHILTQAVGESETLTPEVKQVKLKVGDILLLCSDGLTDMLSDKEIEFIIQKHKDNLPLVVDDLIKKANDKGGTDNISAIVIKV